MDESGDDGVADSADADTGATSTGDRKDTSSYRSSDEGAKGGITSRGVDGPSGVKGGEAGGAIGGGRSSEGRCGGGWKSASYLSMSTLQRRASCQTLIPQLARHRA